MINMNSDHLLFIGHQNGHKTLHALTLIYTFEHYLKNCHRLNTIREAGFKKMSVCSRAFVAPSCGSTEYYFTKSICWLLPIDLH